MKILFVVPDFYPNSTGFSNATQSLIRAIKKYGSDNYELFVYTNIVLNGNEYTEAHVFRICYKKNVLENRFTYRLFAKKRYLDFKKIVDDNLIDIIFFETNTFPYMQNWALKDFGERVFVRIHSTADTEVPVFDFLTSAFANKNRRLVFDFMKNVNNIVSTSTYYINFVKKYFLEDNVYLIWNNKSYGILYNTVSIENKKSKCVTNNTFLTMGKMSSNGLTQKGMLDLINAIYILKVRKMLSSDFSLIIIGDGVYLSIVEKHIRKLGLDSYITIVRKATHDEVFDFMDKAKSVILLSRYEGQSMFITESIAKGKPIIVSDNNGMQDMIQDNFNGFIVKTGDIEDAATKIKMMMDLEPEKLEKFAINSRNIFDLNFSEKRIYEQFDRIMKLKISN